MRLGQQTSCLGRCTPLQAQMKRTSQTCGVSSATIVSTNLKQYEEFWLLIIVSAHLGQLVAWIRSYLACDPSRRETTAFVHLVCDLASKVHVSGSAHHFKLRWREQVRLVKQVVSSTIVSTTEKLDTYTRWHTPDGMHQVVYAEPGHHRVRSSE
jgi:hypothetical protein